MLRRALAPTLLLLLLAHVPLPAAAQAEGVSAWVVEGPPGAVAPGDEVRFALDVVNDGTETVEGYLQVEESSRTFHPMDDAFGEVRLEPGETYRVNVSVYLPEDAPTGSYGLHLGLDEPRDVAPALVLVSWELEVLPLPPWSVRFESAPSGAAGETVTLDARAQNDGPEPVRLALAAFDPDGILSPALDLSSVDLAAGASERVRVTVTLPAEDDRPWHEVVLRATRTDGQAPVRDARANVFVRPPHPPTYPVMTTPTGAWQDTAFRFQSETPDQEITAYVGQAVATFRFTVEGSGYGEVAYRVREAEGRLVLGASAQGSFFVYPGQDNVQRIGVDVARAAPGTYGLVYEFYRAHDDARVSSHAIPLLVPADEGTATMPAAAPSDGGSAVAPRLEILQIDGSGGVLVPPGAEVEARLRVRLVGGDRPVVVNLSFGALPAGWKVAWPETFSVAPGETREVSVRVRAPDDAEPGQRVSFPFRATTGGATSAASGFVAAHAQPPPHGDSAWTLAGFAAAHPYATGGAVVGVGAALAAIPLWRREWWRYLMAIPLLPLYTRLRKAEVLDHEARERIHQMIVREPGIHYSALKDATGLNVGALVHHLRTLERHGLVASRREGVLRRFYPTGQRLPPPPTVPLTPTQARLVEMLAVQPLTQRELATRLGVTQQGVSYHLKTLERKGVVVARRDGTETRYSPAPAALGPESAPRGLA